ncbi:hypothetical protein AA16663_1485 [Komagataeibacter rhaeticus DSM 16663]|nr:hypothetical protein AA16663_1485 [Komagataeibacter rhaeticus DSM 16663]
MFRNTAEDAQQAQVHFGNLAMEAGWFPAGGALSCHARPPHPLPGRERASQPCGKAGPFPCGDRRGGMNLLIIGKGPFIVRIIHLP